MLLPKLTAFENLETSGKRGREEGHGCESFFPFLLCCVHLSLTLLQFYSERNTRNSAKDGGHCC